MERVVESVLTVANKANKKLLEECLCKSNESFVCLHSAKEEISFEFFEYNNIKMQEKSR